jgi:hypothetical protein
MQPTYVPLGQLFGPQIRHTVPLFQRPYVWTKTDQWEPLWSDILTVAERVLSPPPTGKPVRGHFLGTIVLNQMPNQTGSLPRREVIDGQQRLTTLQLLLKAAQHAFAELEQVAASEGDAAAQKAADIAARQVAPLTENPPMPRTKKNTKYGPPTRTDRPSDK